MKRVLVAFSAGVDSTYLLDIAFRTLGPRCEAVTADSPSLARSSLAEARAFCSERGITHHIIPTNEFSEAEYTANDGRRCYFCKSALFAVMNTLAETTKAERGEAALLLGAIAEDFGDIRPGLQAAAEAGAVWPLATAGFNKDDVRTRSKALGLTTWDRPAEPCLASRVPYGESVTVTGMHMIEGAEAALHWIGVRECRARHHTIGQGRGLLCRIEVPLSDLDIVVRHRQELMTAITALGYQHVALDLAGFSSGSLNALLSDDERASAAAPAAP